MLAWGRVLHSTDTRLDLEAAFEGLTDKQREALLLYLEGYTQEEIGARLGVNKPAICRRLQRALEAIRSNLN